MNSYHIVPVLNGWALRQKVSETTITTAETKEGILSRTDELLGDFVAIVCIRRADGTVEQERHYPRQAHLHKAAS